MKKISGIVLFFLLFGAIVFSYLKFKKRPAIEDFYQQKTNTKNSLIERKTETTPVAAKELSNEFNEIPLEIISPKNNLTVSTETITIVGKTKPYAEVFVGEKELLADSQGNFRVEYQLNEGENEIVIVVNDERGNYAEKTLRVNLETNE